MAENESPVGDEMEQLGGQLRSVFEGVTSALATVQETQNAMLEEIRNLRPAAQEEPEERDTRMLPGRPSATDTTHDRFDQLGFTRADFELASVMLGAAARATGTAFEPSEEFMAARNYHLFEAPRRDPEKYGQVPMVRAQNGKLRSMDTAESGFGADLIGTAYERDMWMAARNRDPLLNLIQEIEVRENSQVVPVDGSLPEMLLAAESTTENASNYATSKTGSSKVTQSPKKFTIQSIWSGELDEDSIIPYTPFLRRQLAESFRLHLASAYYNGDTTGTSTGNINKDDGTPAATKHYLAWDGIRHKWLVDASTQGADAGGNVTLDMITAARGRLNGAGNDVDAGVSNIDWSAEVSDLLLIVDRDTYYYMVANFDDIVTVERYGQGATILTGELARLGGMRVISPSYASKTEADGKASDTGTNNVKGQITVVNTKGCLGGVRRGVEFHFDRVQRTDQYLLEMYTRRSFNTFSNTVAAGVYNITV